MEKFKCTKSEFLAVLSKNLKGMGVAVIEDGKKSQSLESYWNLYKLIKKIEVATSAAAGQVSLSGVGTHKFAVCGRNEKKCPRYKFKLSSATQNIFIADQTIVSENAPADTAEFEARVEKMLEVLYNAEAAPKSGDTSPAPEVV